MKTKNTAGPRLLTNRLLPALCVAVVATVCFGLRAQAQSFSGTFDLSGGGNNVSSFAFNGTPIANLTISSLTKVGISSTSSTANFRGDNWPTGATNGSNTFTGSIDLGKYIQFTLTASAGYVLDMSTISFGVGRSATGPRQFEWRSSVDSYAATINGLTTINASVTQSGGVITTPDANAGYTGNVLTTSGAAFEDLNSITLRIYAYNAEATGGTGGLQGNLSFSGLLTATGGGGTDYYWTGGDGSLGGSGTWASTGATWSATNSPITEVVWDPAKKAIFTNTAGTVTVSTVSANAGIQFATTGYSLTNGTLTLGGASAGLNTITTDTGVTTTIGSILAGTTGMTKSGAGTLVLSGANTMSGGLNIAAGGVSVASAGNLGDAANDVVFAGGTLFTTASFGTGSGSDFSGSGSIDIAAGTILTNNGAFNMSALTLIDTGTLVLNGATRSVGNLAFTAGGTVSGSGAISATGLTADSLTTGTATVNPDIVFSSGSKNTTVGTGGNLVLNGNFTGLTVSDRISKLGAGTLVVNGTSTGGYRLGASGTTNGGTLVVGTATSIGANTFQFNYGTLIASAPMTITNALSIGGRSTTEAVVGGTAAIEFSGPVSWFVANTVNAHLNVDNDSTFSGVVSSATTTDTKLVFGGTGTMTMSGASANTFTNAVVVSNSLTLELAKTADTTSLSGSSVEVLSSAKLLVSTSNQVNDSAAVTLSGGTIARGSGVSETFGNLNLTADSFLDYGSGAIGTLTFGTYSPVSKLSINNFLEGNVLRFTTDLSTSINTASLFDFDNGFIYDWEETTPGFFTITAIPEPSTYVAAAGLLGLMLWPVRRRLLRDAQSVLGLRAPMRDRLAKQKA
jgi:fibronectin-binding autotransporter adhesin